MAQGPGRLRAPCVRFICIRFVQVVLFTWVEKGAPRVAVRVYVLCTGENALMNLRESKKQANSEQGGVSRGSNIFLKRNEASKALNF